MIDEMLLVTVDQNALDRVKLLEAALRMLRSGQTPCEVRIALRERMGVHRVKAWRIVSMAEDMA